MQVFSKISQLIVFRLYFHNPIRIGLRMHSRHVEQRSHTDVKGGICKKIKCDYGQIKSVTSQKVKVANKKSWTKGEDCTMNTMYEIQFTSSINSRRTEVASDTAVSRLY